MVPNFVQIDELDYKQNLKQIENAGVSFPMGELTISFQPVPEAFAQWSVPYLNAWNIQISNLEFRSLFWYGKVEIFILSGNRRQQCICIAHYVTPRFPRTHVLFRMEVQSNNPIACRLQADPLGWAFYKFWRRAAFCEPVSEACQRGECWPPHFLTGKFRRVASPEYSRKPNRK